MASTALFDRWSRSYDRAGLQSSTYRPIHRALLRRSAGTDPETILDLGCGTGQLTLQLCESFPRATIIGADLSPGMLHKAADRLSGTDAGTARLVLADAQRLPIASGSLDLVTCTESFHWYPDQQAAVDGLYDAMRPGGRLLIVSIATATRLGDDTLRRMSSAAGAPQVRALPPQRLRRLLESSGFEITHQRRIPRIGLIPWPVLTDGTRK